MFLGYKYPENVLFNFENKITDDSVRCKCIRIAVVIVMFEHATPLQRANQGTSESD